MQFLFIIMIIWLIFCAFNLSEFLLKVYQLNPLFCFVSEGCDLPSYQFLSFHLSFLHSVCNKLFFCVWCFWCSFLLIFSIDLDLRRTQACLFSSFWRPCFSWCAGYFLVVKAIINQFLKDLLFTHDWFDVGFVSRTVAKFVSVMIFSALSDEFEVLELACFGVRMVSEAWWPRVMRLAWNGWAVLHDFLKFLYPCFIHLMGRSVLIVW